MDDEETLDDGVTVMPWQQQDVRGERMDAFYNVVVNFFSTMSSDQWVMLKSGTPDAETKIKMADILLTFIYSVCEFLVAAYQNSNIAITEESVMASVGNTLTQSFAQALNIQEEVDNISASNLQTLMAKEVTERVNLDIAPESGDLGTTLAKGSYRLNEMVSQALKMIKEFCAKVFCKPCTKKTDSTYVRVEEEEEAFPNAQDESLSSSMAIEFQSIIEEEILKINSSLLEHLDDQSQMQIVMSHSQEIECIAVEMVDAIGQSMSADPEPDENQQNMKENTFNSFIGRIKGLFDTLFAKAIFCKTLKKIQSEVQDEQGDKICSSALSDRVELILQGEDPQLLSNESDIIQNIASNPVGLSVDELSTVIYMNSGVALTQEDDPESGPAQSPSGMLNVPEGDVPVYNKIRNSVRQSNELVDWWSTTQSKSHSERVTLNLIESVIKKEKDPEQSCKAQGLKQKIFLRILIEKLVTLIYKKAQITWPMTNPSASIERILDATWSVVSDVSVNINPAMLEKLPKTIFKELCNKWGPALNVLASLDTQTPEIEQYIACSIRDHLLRPKEGPFSNFFRLISKPFRRRPEVPIAVMPDPTVIDG